MNTAVIPFRIAPLSPAFGKSEEMYCGKKKMLQKI
jgi:hypothetical protein